MCSCRVMKRKNIYLSVYNAISQICHARYTNFTYLEIGFIAVSSCNFLVINKGTSFYESVCFFPAHFVPAVKSWKLMFGLQKNVTSILAQAIFKKIC
jgi:hypothetical protein